MPTFQSKPETVDARQFEGGVQNGSDLAFWVNSNGGSAAWRPEVTGREAGNQFGVRWEHVKVLDMPYSHKSSDAYVGDWIVQRQSGKFEVMRPQEFELEFHQV